MLKNLLDYKFRILGVIPLIIALACVRSFENELFYDPFLEYFKSNYQNINLPKVDDFYLLTSYCFRYFINSMLSLSIIYIIFKDFEMIRFVSILYLIFFVVLIILFCVTLKYFGSSNKMSIFYIRRFLIQPIFLMLFLAGFYFQKKVK